MKRIITLIILISISASVFSLSALADRPSVSAQSAILYCADTGDVLYEHFADEHMLIASTTKIMTAIVVIENCDMDEKVKIKPEWCCVEGSSMYLEPEKSYTVRELLTGMMLASGNDAATALACYVSGDELSFSGKMNAKAKELGLNNSSFTNPHGLDGEEHYSTARDLARLAAYCMENEDFRSIVSRRSATIGDNTFYNHNRLLSEYEGCIGVKTGYTMAAGRTLVSCAERNGMRLICVTLNAPDDWDDHKKLLDYGFENYTLNTVSAETFSLALPVVSAAKNSAIAVPANEIRFLTSADDSVNIQIQAPRVIFAGGIKGEKIGKIQVFVNGELEAEENLVYTESVPVDDSQRLSRWEQILRVLNIGIKPYYIADGKT